MDERAAISLDFLYACSFTDFRPRHMLSPPALTGPRRSGGGYFVHITLVLPYHLRLATS